jgi:hypothetical protein
MVCEQRVYKWHPYTIDSKNINGVGVPFINPSVDLPAPFFILEPLHMPLGDPTIRIDSKDASISRLGIMAVRED